MKISKSTKSTKSTMTLWLVGLLVGGFFGIATALADSCTNWMLQPDGSQWRECVNNQGVQYCQMIPRGGQFALTVPCK